MVWVVICSVSRDATCSNDANAGRVAEKMAELLNQYDETIDTAAFGVKGCRVNALTGDGKLMKMPAELLNYRHPQPETVEALLLSKGEG